MDLSLAGASVREAHPGRVQTGLQDSLAMRTAILVVVQDGVHTNSKAARSS